MSMKKLQTEIDRVLKKVGEGVETFESIFDKIHTTTNGNQKEKYEQDLKKEIKKLQRLRDQIKTWLASNEIKDKRALMDNRKLIETQMERFKAIEKEMKTKAFSKEGLLQREKMDPKEKEKADACDWLSTTVDELSRQIEMAEFELETLQGSKKGKKDQQHRRVTEIEHTIERNLWHINRLELMLRLLENDHLETDKVLSIKEDVNYYLECHQEPDFEENEFIYEDLNLEEEEELYAIRTDEYHNELAKLEKDDDKPSSKRTSSRDKDKDKEDELLSQSNATKSKPHTPTSASTIEDPKSVTSPTKSSITSPITSKSGVTSPSTSNHATNHTSIKKSNEQESSQPSAWVEPPKIVDPVKPPIQSSTSLGSQSILSSHYSEKKLPSESAQDVSQLPSSLADLAASFESIKVRASKPDLLYTQQMLEASLQHVPDLIDSERPKTYQPRMPYPSPSYYPQQPLAIFDNSALFEKFDMNALFFIFYYQQGSYQQYLAAKELKKQSWRFHKKYLTWFQRHEEPKIITEDYEQGTYIYFDYEGAWCQRKKTDFRFEYRFLEEA